MFRQFSELPDGLLDCRAFELYRRLEQPSVIHLRGTRQPPIFISVLQHGNEDGGWEVVRSWLKTLNGELPRSIVLFIANVEAARSGRRRLDHQPDFNRCWPGGPKASSALHRALAELTDQMRRTGLFVSIDLHNNSGKNPHYAAINRLDPRWVFLAQEFEQQAVYFRLPKGTQSDAFSSLCPSATLELGKAGTTDALDHTVNYLDRIARMDDFPETIETRGEFQLYQTVAKTTISPERTFAFTDSDCEICFRPDIERFNFRPLKAGTVLATLNTSDASALVAATESGDDVTSEYFEAIGGQLRVARDFTPAMLSTDVRVVRQDCLCYVMENLGPHLRPSQMTPIYRA